MAIKGRIAAKEDVTYDAAAPNIALLIVRTCSHKKRKVLLASSRSWISWLSYEPSDFASLNFCHVLGVKISPHLSPHRQLVEQNPTDPTGSDGTCQDLRCDIVGCSSTCLHASPCSWDVVFCQSSATITGHKSYRR